MSIRERIYLPYWCYREWWAYVLDDSGADKEYGPFNPYFWRFRWPWSDEYVANYFGWAVNWLSRCKCRAQGHLCGVYFYNVGGFEPDMRCKGCGEDIG